MEGSAVGRSVGRSVGGCFSAPNLGTKESAASSQFKLALTKALRFQSRTPEKVVGRHESPVKDACRYESVTIIRSPHVISWSHFGPLGKGKPKGNRMDRAASRNASVSDFRRVRQELALPLWMAVEN